MVIVSGRLATILVEQREWTWVLGLPMILADAYAPGREDQRNGDPEPAQAALAPGL